MVVSESLPVFFFVSCFWIFLWQTSFDYFIKNAVSIYIYRGDKNIIDVNGEFSFPHSVVSAESAAAAAEIACRCPELELAIPLRLGIQAAGYVALGNSAWWAAKTVGGNW